MTDVRKGGLALIIGNVALLLTMALHPTGQQLAANLSALALLNTAVHTLAICAIPVLFYGALALSRHLEAPLAAIFYAFALSAGMCAAAMSGYVAPAMLSRAARATDVPSRQFWRALFGFSGTVNQAFARILVIGGAIAIILWSCAMLARGLRWYGIVSNGLIIIAVIAGLPLDVHGYGAVVLLQGGWFVTAGAQMWRGFPPPPASRGAAPIPERSTGTA
ncbi:MAG TPA: hypothetical protein VI258_03715 [Rhodanobacteraceae bacterium]